MRHFLLLLFALALIFTGCDNKSGHDQHDHDQVSEDNPNEVLSNQVDEIHMDAMGKMDEVIRLKTQLQEKLKETKLATETKTELEGLVNELDSANKAMMTWMHGMNNLPDSADSEKTREFYESQLEAIKKIREVTNEVIDKAKGKIK